ncbi:MAG: MBL fold metallo-hydrolase [Myxococcota bacterium]
MIFRQLFDRDTSTLTYLIAGSRRAALVDPVASQVDTYLQLLRELDLTLAFAIDTHVHADHVTALGELREQTGCTTMMGHPARAACVSQTIHDGDIIDIDAGVQLRAIHTPGHTDDSYSFVTGDRVLTGDTLLIRGTGRTDFQNGDAATQYDSLFGKLLRLPPHTRVFPGHDYRGFTESTIAEELRHNPRLAVDSVEEYVALMGDLALPNPRYMDVAVPANLRCGKAAGS